MCGRVGCGLERAASGGGLRRQLPVERCCSARGLRADRRDKLLKWLDTGGSKLGDYIRWSQSGRRMT